jgi:dihydrofolate synthase/folylpolyglutamate synthase
VDYPHAVAYLSRLKRFGIRPGLDRTRAMLSRLGDPHEKWPAVHVAGTNGKGSVVAQCAAILGAAGLRVGRYHSPYVFDLRERVMIGDRMIPKQEFAALMTRIAPVAEEVSAGESGPVTEFELKTAVGFTYFAQESVDVAVVETGMGGRLDATNVLFPQVCAVTNVGLDHTAILGDTVAAIAREKAGIIKPGVRFLTAALDRAALEVLHAASLEMMSGITHVRHASTRPMVHGRSAVWWESQGLHVRTPRMYLKGLRVRMLGTHQRENAALAVAIVEAFASAHGFDIPDEAYAEGLRRAVMPGRMQVVRTEPRVILDGAHNRDAAKAVRAATGELLGTGRLHAVVGMTKGHDPKEFLAALTPISGNLILTRPQDQRGVAIETLQSAADRLGLAYSTEGSAPEALRLALQDAAAEDTVLVTGSFYTVGDLAEQVESARAGVPVPGS